MVSCVYEVTHKESGERYVGLTSRKVQHRWRSHVAQANHKPKGRLQRAIRQHGAAHFTVRTRAELPTFAEAQIAERILIALERPELNALRGGEGRLGGSGAKTPCRKGATHTAESRALIGDANRGKTLSAETRAKISQARAGKPGPKPTAETRVKLSAAQLGNTKMLGKKHSAETGAKISAAMQGNTNRRASQ